MPILKGALVALCALGLLGVGCACSQKAPAKEDASKYALVDLHLHLDGSLSPAAVVKMAEMSNEALPTTDLAELSKLLSVPENCKDLNEYLECFSLPLQVMQNPEAIAYGVCDLVQRLDEQGLLYAEIRFAPQLHLQKGLTQQAVVEAAIQGLNQGLQGATLDANLILCCMRGDSNGAENLETVRLTQQYLGQGVVACDLAGAEALFPSQDFQDLFEYASTLGVPFTFHAGEASGADSVLTGISFGAQRIGHGIRTFDDPAAKEVVRQKGVTLEICPTSNLDTRALQGVEALKDYPLDAFFKSQVAITINTDNMTVSNTTLQKEFAALLAQGVITPAQAQEMVYCAVDAAFLDQEQKAQLKARCAQRMG